MKSYKATLSFAGEVSMAIGEVRELDGSLAEPLVACGYLEEVTKKESKSDKSGSDGESPERACGKSE